MQSFTLSQNIATTGVPEVMYFNFQGKPADYFVLILEGRVQAEMGRENLVFESGPFTFFGTQSLNQNIGVGKL